MDLEMILSIAGIGLTVVFGIIGLRYAQRRRVSQKQKVGAGSVAVQSGRDTKIEKRDD